MASKAVVADKSTSEGLSPAPVRTVTGDSISPKKPNRFYSVDGDGDSDGARNNPTAFKLNNTNLKFRGSVTVICTDAPANNTKAKTVSLRLKK